MNLGYIEITEDYYFKNKQRWYLQYLTILIVHVFTFTVIVYKLENILFDCNKLV